MRRERRGAESLRPDVSSSIRGGSLRWLQLGETLVVAWTFSPMATAERADTGRYDVDARTEADEAEALAARQPSPAFT